MPGTTCSFAGRHERGERIEVIAQAALILVPPACVALMLQPFAEDRDVSQLDAPKRQ